MSFHKYGDFFPGTGALADTGHLGGSNYSVNVPLQEGVDDESYRFVFEPVMQKVRGTSRFRRRKGLEIRAQGFRFFPPVHVNLSIAAGPMRGANAAGARAAIVPMWAVGDRCPACGVDAVGPSLTGPSGVMNPAPGATAARSPLLV